MPDLLRLSDLPDGAHATVERVVADGAAIDAAALLAECKRKLPAYMIPARIALRDDSLPRNPNGKIDRNLLRTTLESERAS